MTGRTQTNEHRQDVKGLTVKEGQKGQRQSKGIKESRDGIEEVGGLIHASDSERS